MKILITGATGLVGREIVEHCTQKGYIVHYLTTNKEKIKSNSVLKGFYWNPETQEIDSKCLEGINAIINLAGASISQRWTPTNKLEIANSRVNSVKLLHKLLSENTHQVTFLASASALGIYPSSFKNEYDETNKDLNPTFLGRVVYEWEKEIDKIKSLDISVSKLRIGIVLSKDGGALQQMVKPVKLGFGAGIGNGKQYQSWIHIKDLSDMFLFVIEKKLTGTFNAVSSNPITNNKLTKAIAITIKKPLWLPNIPSFLIKLLLGEMSALLLESQKLSNAKILNQGFKFKYDLLEKALEDCLN